MSPIALALLALVVAGQGTPLTVYQIQLRADGSAIWTVEHRYPLGDQVSSQLFEQASKSLESYATDYGNRLASLVGRISEQLGRPVSVEGLNVTARVVETLTGRVGTIRVEFTWIGFAQTHEDGRLEVGDVFIGGLVLLEGESLRLAFPQGYETIKVAPNPDASGPSFVEWGGRRVFPDGEPYALLVPASPHSGPASGPSGSTGRSAPFVDPWTITLFAAPTISAVVAALVWTRRRSRPSPQWTSDEVGAVLEVIRRYGGTVTQSKIVKETGLSKSTVSTVLKILEREGVVARQKAGREKLVRLLR